MQTTIGSLHGIFPPSPLSATLDGVSVAASCLRRFIPAVSRATKNHKPMEFFVFYEYVIAEKFQ